MNQSTILVVSLIALFVLYLAAKGRLSAYVPIFTGTQSSSGSSTGSKVAGAVGTAAKAASTAAVVFA